jgi:hypothetical protein
MYEQINFNYIIIIINNKIVFVGFLCILQI